MFTFDFLLKNGEKSENYKKFQPLFILVYYLSNTYLLIAKNVLFDMETNRKQQKHIEKKANIIKIESNNSEKSDEVVNYHHQLIYRSIDERERERKIWFHLDIY